MDEGTTAEWARLLLKESLLRGDRTLLLDADTNDISVTTKPKTDDPEKLKYIRKLSAYTLGGRDIVAKFNYILLITLLTFTLLHWSRIFRSGRRRQRRWVQRKVSLLEGHGEPRDLLEAYPIAKNNNQRGTDVEHTPAEDIPSSSSSSTLQGISSSLSGAADNVDLERQPLLGYRGEKGQTPPMFHTLTRARNIIAAWLMYQPRPLPLMNRTLPSNGTTLFVLAYVGVNIFLQLYRGSLRPEYFFAFADRAGYVFNVNLPLLYILAAKNQPVKFLTSHSYESLNIFHRRVGELLCFVALVHFAGLVAWNKWLSPRWLVKYDLLHYLLRRISLLGIGTFVCYELLYATSLGSFRQRWYELFLASHILLQLGGLFFLYKHFWTSRPYVLASLAIFVCDRVVWRLALKSARVWADVRVLEDGKTLMLSSEWDIPHRRGIIKGFARRLFRQDITSGWEPMDHVFITIPALGSAHALQAHPFTIASAAPGGHLPSHQGEDTPPTRAQFNLLIRSYSGFTADLLRHACTNKSVQMRVDGPYGSSDAMDMLRDSDRAVLIAGGSGVAVIFPLVWALAHSEDPDRRPREIHFLWVIHSASHRSWLPAERLEALRSACGVHVTIPGPTSEVGRPDVDAYVADLASASFDRSCATGVVVSGPDNLNRTTRNACARAVRDGANIDLRVEKFGW
ncbi:hypothetical protein BX600DRAFT_432644 [Xylariales sp. PMI_506]|nr:hypothetical protein BX600DRAFT_432644 [Xylariales sp. PMI_506]